MSPTPFSAKSTAASPTNSTTSTLDTPLPLDTNILSENDHFFSQEEDHHEESPLVMSNDDNNATVSIAPATHKVFSVVLLNRHKRDHIRFHKIPESVESVITTIISAWGGHVHCPRSSIGTIEYKLAWKAWSEFRTDKNSIGVRSFLMDILKRLALNGWNFGLGMEITKTERGKDVMFFESGEPDPDVDILCVNFPKGDRIKVIGAGSEVINGIGQAIKGSWPWGLKEGGPSSHKSFEFKLGGYPWWTGDWGGALGERKCNLMGKILQELRGHGYRSYATVRITKKEKEMPTLFFRKVTNVFK